MSSLLCLSIALLHLLSCFNEVTVTAAATTSTCENRCQQLFGNCLCYCELEESLLATEENTLNLTKTFFPPEDNPPEFVTVIYHFNDSIDPQTWYWSAQTSHFLHPFEVFQFLSLFFSKPEPYYTGFLDITVKAECADLSSSDIEKLQLLTQRLKLYAERGNLGISSVTLRDEYFAKAYNQKTLKKVIESQSNRIGNITICASFFVIFISIALVLLLVLIFFSSKSHSKSEWIEKVNKKKPAVLSLAVLSLIVSAYSVCLTSSAFYYWSNPNDKTDALFHHFDKNRNLVPLCIAIIVDGLCFLGCTSAIVAAALFYYCEFTKIDCAFPVATFACYLSKCIKHQRSLKVAKDHSFIILSFTVLCPLFSIIAHSPFIAISYLNDGNHASSIFIYYTVLCYMIFGLLWLLFHWYQHYSNQGTTATKNKKENKCCCFSPDMNEWCCYPNINDAEEDDTKRWCCIGVTASIFLTLVLFLGLIVIISCYFVLIPINKAISDAPNQILSIYQSGGFIIGSFIVYNVLKYFYSKKKDKTIRENNIDNIHVILQTWLSQPKQQLHQIQQQFSQLEKQVRSQPQQQQSDRNSQQQKCEELIQQLTELKQHIVQFYGNDNWQMQAANRLQKQLDQLQQEFPVPP